MVSMVVYNYADWLKFKIDIKAMAGMGSNRQMKQDCAVTPRWQVWLAILRLLVGPEFRPCHDQLFFFLEHNLYSPCLLLVGLKKDTEERLEKAMSFGLNQTKINWYRLADR